MLKLHTTPQAHEDVFLRRYGRLLAWALQLTNNNRAQAEDLLHDAFIQFTVARPDLDAVANLDGYLYGTLRHLHLSQVRKAARGRLRQLSVVEYESAERGLRSVDPRDLIQTQDELRRVCRYVCARKETARAASVLLLRFFHGYYPSEIAQVLLTTPEAVKVRLRAARREARAYLEDPKGLGLIGGGPPPDEAPAGFARAQEDFLGELRETVFKSCSGSCLSARRIKDVYSSAGREPVETKDLAHVVSCPVCLDTVNGVLDLPLLSDRYPTDSAGKAPRSGKGPGGGGPGGTAGGGAVPKGLRREAREVFEHEPRELYVAVNGYMQGSQRINSGLSEQTLDIDLAEPIAFVEIFSEQQVRLLMMNVGRQPPEGPGEQSTRIELSENRSLSVLLRFGSPWPTLHVSYHDPTFKEDAEAEQPEADAPRLATTPATAGPAQERSGNSVTHQRLLLALARRLLRRFPDRGFWLRPATVTAVFAAVLVAALLFLRLNSSPVHTAGSAAALLRQSSAAEESAGARADQVLHRTVTLEERSADGLLIARRRVEVWQSAGRGITARRLYDERGQLVAGDWQRADGVETLYGHGLRPRVRLAPEAGGSKPAISFDDAWRLSPSAKEFAALVGDVEGARVEEQPGRYVITYAKAAGGNGPGLSKAVLVLSRADLHPVEQTLVIRDEGEAREFRYVEAGFERRAPSTVAPEVFEPEPELLGPAGRGGRAAEPAKEGNMGTESRPVAGPRAAASADLEVEALRLLSEAGADLGEQVSVTRAADGVLRVEGIVETPRRKEELLRALAGIRGNPAVQVDVSTVAEAVARRREGGGAPGRVIAEGAETIADTAPADADLRKYFAARGTPEAAADEEVRRFCNRAVTRSYRVVQRAWALKRLAERFTPEDLRALTPDARGKWLSMIRGHARAIQQENAALRQELQPVFGAPAGEAQEAPAIADDAGLVRAVERLAELCSANDAVVRSAFTISPNASRAASVRSPQFWNSLRSVEALAAQIQRQ